MSGFIGGGVIGGGIYFSKTLFTGNGTTQDIATRQNLSGLGGLSIIKNRIDISDIIVVDTVRGATKYLVTNLSSAEATDANKVSAFTGSGFSVGSDNATNGASDGIVSFSWIERARLLDIVQYSGTGANQSVAHNLAVTPGLIIVRSLDTFGNWCIKTSALANNRVLFFNAGTGDTSNTYWNNTAATSTHFTVGTNAVTNKNGDRFIAYLFGDLDGQAKHASYSGNGNVAGPTITAGFRPSVWLIKGMDTTGGWYLCFVDGAAIYSVDLSDDNAQVTETSSFSVSATGLQITTTSTGVNLNTSSYLISLWR